MTCAGRWASTGRLPGSSGTSPSGMGGTWLWPASWSEGCRSRPRTLSHAIEPRRLAELALRTAEDTDGRVASLPPERMWPGDPESPINPLRATHRGEHLDQIEAVLGG